MIFANNNFTDFALKYTKKAGPSLGPAFRFLVILEGNEVATFFGF